ncbi:MAG: hypothetical protein JW889_02510 [Verrucomicrobia bacterium]|nr:hypothetical protein [Verrucomicrobiota bacterium]
MTDDWLKPTVEKPAQAGSNGKTELNNHRLKPVAKHISRQSSGSGSSLHVDVL